MEKKKEKAQERDPGDFWDEFCKEMETSDVFYKAAQETLAAGHPIYYKDENYTKNRLIVEYPNGKKQLLKTWWVDGEYHKEVIKDLN